MTSLGRVVLALLIGLTAFGAGHAGSRLLHGSDRRLPAPVIDLDNLPAVEAPPTTRAPRDGATIVPPPTLAPTPRTPTSRTQTPRTPTSRTQTPGAPPTSPPATAPAPPPPPDGDDGDDGDDGVEEPDD